MLCRVALALGLSNTIIYTSELILCSTICVPSATRHNIYMYPYFLFAAIHHLKSSPTFSVRPCSSVGRVTEDLIRRSWVRFPPRSKDFSLPCVVPCFPLLGLTPSGLFMGLSSSIIYTSELILCSTICVPSATRHNIHSEWNWSLLYVFLRFLQFLTRLEGADYFRKALVLFRNPVP